MNKHLSTDYHDVNVSYTEQTDIVKLMDTRHLELYWENRARLKPIVKIFDFCGKNNISLSGRNDDGLVDLATLECGEGNFCRLLKFRAIHRDENLKDQIQKVSRNA